MNDDIINLYEEEYNFDNDDSILDSFQKIYKKHDIKYKPQNNTKFIRVRYLLKKLKDNDDIDRTIYNHFHTSLSEKINYIIKYRLMKMNINQDLLLIIL